MHIILIILRYTMPMVKLIVDRIVTELFFIDKITKPKFHAIQRYGKVNNWIFRRRKVRMPRTQALHLEILTHSSISRIFRIKGTPSFA